MLKKSQASLNQAVQLLTTGQKQAQGIIAGLIRGLYLTLPNDQRLERGLLWAEQRLGLAFYKKLIRNELPIIKTINNLLSAKSKELRILGIFILAEYGRAHPQEVFLLFRNLAADQNAQVRNAAARSFRMVINNNKTKALTFLNTLALDLNSKVRRFVCETLKPNSDLGWLKKEPKKSLDILRKFMKDGDPEVKKSLSENLAELSRAQPALIYNFLATEVTNDNLNTYWIVYRAFQHLISNNKYRPQILTLLQIAEYNYEGKRYR